MKTARDYTGQTIFVGIDVHKVSYSVAVVHDGAVVKRDRMTASPEGLVQYLKKFFNGAKIKSAYEAGFSGFGLHRCLLANGIENIVVHAASIEISARDRVKTDKRDATKIAIHLSTNRLRGIHVPSKEVAGKRELTRHRANLVKDRNRIAVRLKHKANYHGLIGAEDSRRVSSKWILNLLEQEMGYELRLVVNDLASEWDSLNQKIRKFDALLKEQAAADPEHEKVYRSLKGIGPTAARVLSNELGDMSQFRSERSLSSYTGLTPCEFSSGESIRKGHISRQGKPLLRAILVQVAWTAIRYDGYLREVYDRIAKRAGGKRAIIAVARRLIGHLRACFKSGQLYQPQMPASQRK